MPRRSAAHAEKTRLALIDAGRDLFAEKGYSGASTAEISAQAGLTEGAFFHHFRTKKDLFAAVFETLEADIAAKATKAAHGKPPLEAFMAGCRVYLDYAQNSPYRRVVMVEAQAVLGGVGWRARDSALGLPTLERGLARMIDADIIPSQPLRPLATLILGALNEAGLALALKTSGVTAQNCAAALQRLIAREDGSG